MPARQQGQPIAPDRLIAVLQGWNVTEEQVTRQIEVTRRAGVAGVLVSYAKIERSWEPRLMK